MTVHGCHVSTLNSIKLEAPVRWYTHCRTILLRYSRNRMELCGTSLLGSWRQVADCDEIWNELSGLTSVGNFLTRTLLQWVSDHPGLQRRIYSWHTLKRLVQVSWEILAVSSSYSAVCLGYLKSCSTYRVLLMQDIDRKLSVELAFKLQFYNFLFTIRTFEQF
jgi:hypothetical protein